MKFKTTKQKFKNIFNKTSDNKSNIEVQKETNSLIDNSVKEVNITANIFKNYNTISSDWLDFESAGSTDDTTYIVYRYTNIDLEIPRIPETWIPFIKTRLIFKYVEAGEERYWADNFYGTFIEQEDIIGEDDMKKIIIHGSFYALKLFFPLDQPVNKNLQFKMEAVLYNPKTFI